MNKKANIPPKEGTLIIDEKEFHYIDFINGENNSEIKENNNLTDQIFLFAHGSGAGMDSDFIQSLAKQISKKGVRTITFDFSYMIEMKQSGKRRPPPKVDKLVVEFLKVKQMLENKLGQKIRHIGGKSMGGRIATLLASGQLAESASGEAVESGNKNVGSDKLNISSIHCFGYPFYPKGKSDPELGKWRLDHLKNLNTPAYIYQGTRDELGDKDHVLSELAKSSNNSAFEQVEISWFEDGNHDLKPRKASGFSQEGYLAAIATMVSNRIG